MLGLPGRHPMRPGHIRLKVSAEGHVPLTHLFVRDDRYLGSDAVFGVRNSLNHRHGPGVAPDGRRLEQSCYTVQCDFRLLPLQEPAEPAKPA